MTQSILRIDSSARRDGSVSRRLTDALLRKLTANNPEAKVVTRDVSGGLPLVSEEMIGAFYTPAEARSPAQNQLLALSDTLVAELKDAEVLVIGVPVYNFSVPASLKAYVDLICRVGETFKYTEEGPVGLLADRKAYLVVASGGTPVGSDYDYAARYMRHILGFIGITDVELVAADQLMIEGEEKVDRVEAELDARLAAE